MSGEIFSKTYNQEYFGSKSWYFPIGENVEYLFNDCQSANVAKLIQYEKDMSWR